MFLQLKAVHASYHSFCFSTLYGSMQILDCLVYCVSAFSLLSRSIWIPAQLMCICIWNTFSSLKFFHVQSTAHPLTKAYSRRWLLSTHIPKLREKQLHFISPLKQFHWVTMYTKFHVQRPQGKSHTFLRSTELIMN